MMELNKTFCSTFTSHNLHFRCPQTPFCCYMPQVR